MSLAYLVRAFAFSASALTDFGTAIKSGRQGKQMASIQGWRGQSYNGTHARHNGTHGSRRIRAARGAA